MPAPTRIEIYPLASRIVALRLECKSFKRIAKIVTKELEEEKRSRPKENYLRNPKNIDDLERLALDMIRMLNAFVEAC